MKRGADLDAIGRLREALYQAIVTIRNAWPLLRAKQAILNCFLAFWARYLTILFTLHANAFKYTDSFTLSPPRTLNLPNP